MSVLKKILTIALCVVTLACSCIVPVSAVSANVIRVGVSGRMAPLMYTDENGSHGIFIDLMNEVAHDAGFFTEYIHYETHMQAVAALDEGKIDAVLGVLASDAEAFSNVITSEEIYSTSVCLVMPHSTDSYTAVDVGAYEMGTVNDNHTELLGTSIINVFSTQEQVYDCLVSGGADCVIAIPECMRYMLRRDKLTGNYTIGSYTISGLSYSIGLSRNNLIISSAVNKSIGRLRTSTKYTEIIKKWGVYTEIGKVRQINRIIGIVAAVVLMVALVIIAFNLRLRHMVKSKTADLSEKIEDLENSSTLRKTLIEHSNAGSMVLRLDGTILLMNDTMRRLAGLGSEDSFPNVSELGFIGRAWQIAPADMDQPELFSETSLDGKIKTYRYFNLRTHNKDERVFMIEDVTHEEMERQELFEESKNKALNRIITGIAHEVKNPLTTIRTYASLAETELADPEFVQAFTEYVPKEVDRISDLIETLVNYSRPVSPEKERFSAGDVAQSCRSLAYVYAKKIEVKSDIDFTLCLNMDKDQYRRVLINFLLNAIQSVEEKTERGCADADLGVAMSIYRDGDQVVTQVNDTGIGMSEEELRQCTEPFFTTKKKGTGMGLALAKQFIKENGGRFEIESKEGVGTSVRMIFTEDTDNE